MTATHPESVSFSDLSRNPRDVAAKATCLGRVRITYRDGGDFMLTTAEAAEQADATLAIASRLFLAAMKHDPSFRTLVLALPDLFPWARHLSDEEIREFAVELFQALSDAAELNTAGAVERAIISWQATARIKADPEQYKDATRPLSGVDLGPVEVHG
jgi:hypothetical protein